MKLILFWIKEMRWAKKYYLNGLISYFMHKIGIITSPTLGIRCRRYKYDVEIWKSGKPLENKIKLLDIDRWR